MAEPKTGPGVSRHAVTLIDGKVAEPDRERLKNRGVDPASLEMGDVPSTTMTAKASKPKAKPKTETEEKE